jgi:hypothetical protein
MQHVRFYLSYYQRVLRRAWNDTWAFAKRQGLLAGTTAALLGLLASWVIDDQADVGPALVGAVAGLLALTTGWFGFQLLLAPALMDRDRTDEWNAYLAHAGALRRKYASNIHHVPSLPVASRQIELRDIRHKIEMVRSTWPNPHYSHGLRLSGARWDEYDELLASNPELYAAVERAYVAAHHVNEALAMRETRARPGQTLGVIPDDGLDEAHAAAGERLMRSDSREAMYGSPEHPARRGSLRRTCFES